MRKQEHSRLRISLALTIIVICLILLAAGLSRKSQLTGQALAADNPTEPQKRTVDTAEALPTAPQTNTEPQTINGVEVRFEEAWQEEEAIAVSVCYDLPDDSDWTIWDSTLERDGKTYHWTEMAPTELRTSPVDGEQELWTFKPEGGVEVETVPADPGQPGYRCETIYFQGATNPTPSTLFTLTIEALEAAPREGEYCSSAYLRKVQDALDARQTGITVRCIEEEYHDGLEVVTKPETMSLEAAKAYLASPDFYLDLNGRRGPWVFTFTLD